MSEAAGYLVRFFCRQGLFATRLADEFTGLLAAEGLFCDYWGWGSLAVAAAGAVW